MTKLHKPSLNQRTYDTLLRWQSYLKQRTGQKISIAKVILYLATGELTLKEGT